MLSKKWTIQLLIGNFAIAFACVAEATPAQKPESIPYNLHDEADKTDIYDIPVQNDEEDIEEEMDELNKEQTLHSIPKK